MREGWKVTTFLPSIPLSLLHCTLCYTETWRLSSHSVSQCTSLVYSTIHCNHWSLFAMDLSWCYIAVNNRAQCLLSTARWATGIKARPVVPERPVAVTWFQWNTLEPMCDWLGKVKDYFTLSFPSQSYWGLYTLHLIHCVSVNSVLSSLRHSVNQCESLIASHLVSQSKFFASLSARNSMSRSKRHTSCSAPKKEQHVFLHVFLHVIQYILRMDWHLLVEIEDFNST